MTTCPRCTKEGCVKDGVVRGKQRWRCRECCYRHTVQQRGKDAHIKRQAVELYLEGLGFRSIGRFLKVSHVAVYNWIKGFGEKLEELRSDDEIEIVEMDEMHTYIGSKKTIAGYGLLLIGLGEGSSSARLAQGTRRREEPSGKK
jgi:transposase-like protein